ncbi:hypothetical protein Tco_0481885 [Tanacetum coccineum]
MLCDLDFEPLSLSLSSLPSCDLMSLTNMLILLHYLESFKSELAEVFVLSSGAFLDSLVLHQLDFLILNRSELGIQENRNESVQVQSLVVLKVVPLAKQDSYLSV